MAKKRIMFMLSCMKHSKKTILADSNSGRDTTEDYCFMEIIAVPTKFQSSSITGNPVILCSTSISRAA
jgi:hypothetical protein